MSTKSMILSAVLLVSAVLTFGQDYAFKVMVAKGKNEFGSGNSWQPVIPGASLKKIDELKVAANAYIAMVDAAGKPLEVKNAGSYKVVDLLEKVSKGPGVLNKYTDFILSSNTRSKNTMSATGAVHRGGLEIGFQLPPGSSSVFADTLSIAWEKDKAAPPYRVTFTTIFGDEVFKTETSDNTVTVNLNDPGFGKNDVIQVQVVSKKDNKASEPYLLRKLPKAEKEKIGAAFREIQAQTMAPTALNKLIQAGFFEQNKLLADAASAYQRAIQLEPGVDYYKELYDAFLLRNGLK